MAVTIGNVIGTLDVSGSPIADIQQITLTESVPHSTDTETHGILVLCAIETNGLIGHLQSPGVWLTPGVDIYDSKSGLYPYAARTNAVIPDSSLWTLGQGAFSLQRAGQVQGVGGTPSAALNPFYQIVGSKYISSGGGSIYWIFQSLAAGNKITLDFSAITADIAAGGGITWAGAKLIKVSGFRGGISVAQPPLPTSPTTFSLPFAITTYSLASSGTYRAAWHTWVFTNAMSLSTGSPTYSGSPLSWGVFAETWSINRTVDLVGGGRVAHFGWGYKDYESSPATSTLTLSNATATKNEYITTAASGGSWDYDVISSRLDQVRYRAYN